MTDQNPPVSLITTAENNVCGGAGGADNYHPFTRFLIEGRNLMKNTNRTITLQAKKWNMLDCFVLVFKAAPIHTCLVFVFTILEALVPSIKIFTTAGFVDTALAVTSGTAEYNEIFKPLFAMFATTIIPHILYVIDGVIENSYRAHVTLRIEEAFLDKKARLKYEHIENSKTHDTIAKASVSSGDTMMNRAYRFLMLADMAVRLISIISVVFVQVWWSGIVSVAVTIPAILFAAKNGAEQYKAFADVEKIERYANTYNTILRTKEYLEERTTFRYTPYMIKRWYTKKKEVDEINLKTSIKAGLRDNVTWVLTWVMAGVILVSLVPALADGRLSSGMFVGISNSVIMLVNMISARISWNINFFVHATHNLKDLTEFTCLEEQEGALDEPVAIPSDSFESIEFRNVSFAYPKTERYILRNCSFKLNAGEHYAFVGINGAGKTTITKLITGLYDNYEGEIFLNGRDLREYSLAELKGYFTIVYQDFAKYQIEFADNIKLGDVLTDDDGRMMQCTREIGLDGVLENLHSGAETPLGKVSENGVDLSGGEWQRLAIARSLYSNSPMKILDEPTAALDPIAESGIYELFRDITINKSAIFITHRLGAAKIADKIIVIDDGKVAEFGSHDELMRRDGIYAEMFNTQRGWYEE